LLQDVLLWCPRANYNGKRHLLCVCTNENFALLWFHPHGCPGLVRQQIFWLFRESLNLLKINHYVLSGNNHNGMLAEQLNRYLNKGLRIMSNERDSVRAVLEAMQLLVYA
jgi:hypothetical protein